MKAEANSELMKEILDENVRFYIDCDNPTNVYVEYPCCNGAIAFEPVSSKVFKSFLGYMYRQESDEIIVPDFSTLIEVKTQDMIYTQTNPVRIHRRIAGSISAGKIAYFLADEQWTTLLITSKGYKAGRSKKLKFLKSALDEEQVLPR